MIFETILRPNSNIFLSNFRTQFYTKKGVAGVLHTLKYSAPLIDEVKGGHWPHLKSLTIILLFSYVNFFHKC